MKSGHKMSKERTAGQVVEGPEARARRTAFILSALGASERLSAGEHHSVISIFIKDHSGCRVAKGL